MKKLLIFAGLLIGFVGISFTMDYTARNGKVNDTDIQRWILEKDWSSIVRGVEAGEISGKKLCQYDIGNFNEKRGKRNWILLEMLVEFAYQNFNGMSEPVQPTSDASLLLYYKQHYDNLILCISQLVDANKVSTDLTFGVYAESPKRKYLDWWQDVALPDIREKIAANPAPASSLLKPMFENIKTKITQIRPRYMLGTCVVGGCLVATLIWKWWSAKSDNDDEADDNKQDTAEEVG